MINIAVCLTLVVCTSAVTPMEKVITLITDLKTEVEAEGVKEATSYAKFAKFCKDNTATETTEIKTGKTKINELSATDGIQSSKKSDLQADVTKRNSKMDVDTASLADDIAACKADQATYEANSADTNKAISSLNGAVNSMTAAKPSLIQLRTVLTRASVRAAVVEKTGVDPKDAAFSYHSHDLIALCQGLVKGFQAKKAELDATWTKRDEACKAEKVADDGTITANDEQIGLDGGQIAVTNQALATAKTDLISTKSLLLDDELYLKEITVSCQARAKDWDQRTKARKGEVGALTGALQVLTGEGKGADYVSASAADTAVNKRAALVATAAAIKKLGQSDEDDSTSFLQVRNTLLSRGLSPEKRSQRVLAALQVQGRKIGSLALSALSVRAQGSPFTKIKGLIEKLMQNLIEESEAEATKKGYCDTQLGKAKHTQAHQFEVVSDISNLVQRLKAKDDDLTASVAKLNGQVLYNNGQLKAAKEERDTQAGQNAAALKTAKGGLASLSEATATLKTYYSNAAKGASFLQASPLDGMEGSSAGFKGSYTGKQSAMGNVLGLLETIKSDFERTIRFTEASESAAKRAYQELSDTLKADSKGKETAVLLDSQDLKSTKIKTTKNLADLTANMGLMDAALKDNEALKPTCIDTTMSYAERTGKRDAEIAALEKAMGQLSPE